MDRTSQNGTQYASNVPASLPSTASTSATLGGGGSVDPNLLASWGFPLKILNYYKSKGISRFFDWQVEALQRSGVLEGGNLVYSAPTSAGKTMVADVLLYKKLLEDKKKGIIILPYVSIAQEKVNSLKRLFRQLGLRIESFAGNVKPRGGLQQVDVAVCTIEKANNMINRLIEEDELSKVGIIVVDELHMLGDGTRGYLLELLLTKLRFLADSYPDKAVPQIVGMSATIPNFAQVAHWLKAQVYVTEFRPVDLLEHLVIDRLVFDPKKVTDPLLLTLKPNSVPQLRRIETDRIDLVPEDQSNLIFLTIETVIEGYSALIFCSTKNLCESISKQIAKNIYAIGGGKMGGAPELVAKWAADLKNQVNFEKIVGLIDALKRCSTGIDASLEAVIRFGVAFHHAGLATEERALLEAAFRDGAIRILCSTTTLSAGVNLPARRVMICSPYDYRSVPLDATSYRQMIGRAGRKGIDTRGEAMLFAKQKDIDLAMGVINSKMQPVRSSLVVYKKPKPVTSSPGKRAASDDAAADGATISKQRKRIEMSEALKRATLEAIVDGLVANFEDLERYFRCTFFYHAAVDAEAEIAEAIEETLGCLKKLDLIYNQAVGGLDQSFSSQSCSQQDAGEGKRFLASPFGRAVISSGVSPDHGTFLMTELDRARRSLCLVNDLHLIYLVTPTYSHNQLEQVIEWSHYLKLFQDLDEDKKSVVNVIGISESYIMGRLSMHVFERSGDERHIRYTRFYASLALYDLVQEVPLLKVAKTYNLTKGMVQSLQQQAAQFAGMLTTFCNKLGWFSLELLIEQFASRLSFGVQRELIDLMRIPCLTSLLARRLFDANYIEVVSLVHSKRSAVEKALVRSTPFVRRALVNIAKNTGVEVGEEIEEEKEENLGDPARSKVFIPNIDQHVTYRQLARMVIDEARQLIESQWGQKIFPFPDERGDQESETEEEGSNQVVEDVRMGTPMKGENVIVEDTNMVTPMKGAPVKMENEKVIFEDVRMVTPMKRQGPMIELDEEEKLLFDSLEDISIEF